MYNNKENVQLGDGTGVDAIVSDDGFWIAFRICNAADDPVGYSTGNALTWSGISTTPGTCSVLDRSRCHTISTQTFSMQIRQQTFNVGMVQQSSRICCKISWSDASQSQRILIGTGGIAPTIIDKVAME